MRILSWNLNGLLSCVKNHSFMPIADIAPDIICCQEIRTKQQMEVIPAYGHHWNPSERDGFHGTMSLSRREPLRVIKGIVDGEADEEGRVLTLEFPALFVVNTYVPNSQKNLRRRQYRVQWDEQFRWFINELHETKPVAICGDFNVAFSEIDVYPENLRQYWAQQGFISEEKSKMEALMEDGFADAFRLLYPNKERAYTWWSNRKQKRAENRGWRLDYFLVSEELVPYITDVQHLTEVMGSDHCPILLELDGV